MLRNRPSLRIEALEPRALMAATAVLNGSTLVVTGTSAEETIVVSPTANAGEVAVTINAVPFGTFTPAAVSVDAKSGSDYVIFEVDGLPATVSGGSGNDRLTGPDVAGQVWNITGSDAGTVGSIKFSQFERIKGGAFTDIFRFQSGGKISGKVEGNDGFDEIDYSALAGPVTVNGITSKSSYIGDSYWGIESFVGSASSKDTFTNNGSFFFHGNDEGATRKVLTSGYIRYSAFENYGSTAPVTFRFFNGDVSGKITAGAGSLLSYRGGRASGVTVDLTKGTATNVLGGISGIQHVYGTTGADVLIGNSKDNQFWGDDGKDLLDGRDGNDYLDGGSHDDLILGGKGNDTLIGSGGKDVMIGGSDKDVLSGDAGNDLMIGGSAPAYDPTKSSTAYAKLWTISAEWTRSDVVYSGRIAHLIKGGGLNGSNVLDAKTLNDDSDADILTGGLGNEWFIIGPPKDAVTDEDLPTPEVVTEV